MESIEGLPIHLSHDARAQPEAAPTAAARTPSLLVPALRGLYDRLEPVSYALLRASFGLILMTHGVPKLLGIGHGSMADPMAASTKLIAEVLHLPGAPWIAGFVALLEGIGGLMLALGVLTRLVAPMVVVQMLVICWLMAPRFAWIDRGFEYPLMLAFVALYIALRGGGPLSLDRRIGREL